MNTFHFLTGRTLGLVATICVSISACAPASHKTTPAPLLQEREHPALAFVSNAGQAPPAVYMEARTSSGLMTFMAGAIELRPAQGNALRMVYVGTNPHQVVAGADRLPGVMNFYRGDDATQWRGNVPTYAAVTYEQLYAGITLRYQDVDGRLKGVYTVEAGADPTMIHWRYEGADQVSLDPASGDLRVRMSDGQVLTDTAPVAWQVVNGVQVAVSVRYAALANGAYGFAVGNFDRERELIIDPELVYATYLGGSSTDEALGIALDGAGSVVVVGRSYSADFPSAGNQKMGDFDIAVAKLNSTGTQLLYVTYIGGQNSDDGLAVAVNGAGEVFVSAKTDSSNFPVKNALYPSQQANANGALVKLSAVGAIASSTYLPFNMWSHRTGRNVALDAASNVYLTGQYYDVVEGENYFGDEVALFKVSADGSQALLTKHYGGQGSDSGAAITLGPNGSIYLTGETDSRWDGFPITAGAIQPLCGRKSWGGDESCYQDAFVLVLDAAGGVTYGSYLSGNGLTNKGNGIAVDGAGEITIVGETDSTNFPTKQAIAASCPGGTKTSGGYVSCGSTEGFVTKLSADGKNLIFSTYLGSVGDDWATDLPRAVAADAMGNVYVVGDTNGGNFPVKDAPQSSIGPGGFCTVLQYPRPCYDVFLTKFGLGGHLIYSTYLGGAQDERGNALALDASGDAYVAGRTTSFDFKTSVGAVQPSLKSGEDMYIAKIGAGGATSTPMPTPQPTPQPTPNPNVSPRLYVSIVIR